VAEDHAVGSTPLGHAAQVRGVAEHFAEWDNAKHHLDEGRSQVTSATMDVCRRTNLISHQHGSTPHPAFP
jgi:hypothetical protein